MYTSTPVGKTQRTATYQKLGIQSEVESASPHRLIQILLDGALSKMAVAKGAMQRGDIAVKGRHISWAISIIDGLRGSLNLERGGSIAANLSDLYLYMNQQLVLANLHNDAAKLDEVAALLGEIRLGWAGIAGPERDALQTTAHVAA